MEQLSERNKYLQQEISKFQAVSYTTKPPQRYVEDNRYYEQNNNQFRTGKPRLNYDTFLLNSCYSLDPQPIESRRLSYRSENTYYPPNLAPPTAQSDLRIPRSLPNGGLANIPNIPLNPHLNGGYPASHDPKGLR